MLQFFPTKIELKSITFTRNVQPLCLGVGRSVIGPSSTQAWQEVMTRSHVLESSPNSITLIMFLTTNHTRHLPASTQKLLGLTSTFQCWIQFCFGDSHHILNQNIDIQHHTSSIPCLTEVQDEPSLWTMPRTLESKHNVLSREVERKRNRRTRRRSGRTNKHSPQLTCSHSLKKKKEKRYIIV